MKELIILRRNKMNYKNIYLKKDNRWELFENPTTEDLKMRYISIAEDVNIAEYVSIAKGVSIAEGVSIAKGVSIAEDVNIAKGVSIAKDVSIAEDVSIAKGVSIKLSPLSIINGYRYNSYSYWDYKKKEGKIGLGCFDRTVKEWDVDFDNNIQAFPLGSKERELRLFVFETHKKHLELTKPDFKLLKGETKC